MALSSTEPTLLPETIPGGILDFSDLDPLLETAPEDFEERVETLIEALDAAGVRLVDATPVATEPGRTLGAGRDPYIRQIGALPQLDRRSEGILARRYALTKRRFAKALDTMGVGIPADRMTDYMLREHPGCDNCKGEECRRWRKRLGPQATALLQLRCREFQRVRNAFIEGSLYIVILALNNVHYLSIPREDLLQEGNASLFRAVDKYDWRKGVRFRTYAEYWVNQSFMEAIYNQSRTVRVPAWVHKTTRKIRRAREQARLVTGVEASDETVARTLDLEAHRVGEILQDNRHTYSMELASTGEGERTESLAETLAGGEDTPAEAMTREASELIPRRVHAALATLPAREREVIASRFGIDGAQVKTLSEMGRTLGVSAERVRQIQESALNRLRGRTEELRLEAL